MNEFYIERYLNVQSANSPSFSPDGENVAFLANTTGVPQVWTIPRTGGWPKQLTFYDERVGTVKYSPQSDQLAFGMDSGGDEREQILLLEGDGSSDQKITDESQAVHNLGGWSADGKFIAYTANVESPTDFHVYVYDLCEGEARKVFGRPGSNRFGAWSPDGEKLAIVHARANFYHDLYIVDVETGEAEDVTPSDDQAIYDHISWANDGSRLYMVTNADRDLRRTVHYDLKDRQMVDIIAWDEWEIEEMSISPDGVKIAYIINCDGYSRMYIHTLEQSQCHPVRELPTGVYKELAWSPQQDEIAFVVDGPRHNSNVWLYDLKSDCARQLTNASRACIPKETLVEPELVRYESFDGLSIPAFYYKPHGAEGSLPVVINIHGGPEGQMRANFDPVTQYLVNQGFAVFAPNFRGSSGYGKNFLGMDDVEKRMDTVKDIRWGVDWLTDKGNADPDRIAVMGGSYGGFMVLACITEYPDMWAAAIDRVGIANFITFLENTGPWRRHIREAEYGSLKDDYEFLENISPIHKADKITTPLLVIHGKNDPRVPVEETEQIIKEVRNNGGSVDYVLFDDEGHGIVKLKNRITAYRKATKFLRKYI